MVFSSWFNKLIMGLFWRPGKSRNRIYLFVIGALVLCTLVMNGIQFQNLLNYNSEVTLVEMPLVIAQSHYNVIKEPVHDVQESSTPKFQDLDIWKPPESKNHRTCMERTAKETGNKILATDGFLLSHANGGLNQMKLGISDMVVIAKLMNATLIVPSLDHASYWNDPSEFQDIFDLKNFIEVLKDDVNILESLPSELESVTPIETNPVSWSKASYYRSEMKNVLKKRKVVKFLKSDSRLANNIAGPLQRLRCRTMYKALKFRSEIEELGLKLIDRLKNNTEEPFIALHLRYEKDMLAFTGCSHGLKKSEHDELKKMRYEVSHWKAKEINSSGRRLQGYCPMTPNETALFLEGIGYPSHTKIYVVGGEVFGEDGVEALREKFPNLYSKTSLATDEELKTFGSFQNQLAAIDYVVSLYSDVFVYSYDGNMARALQGHRKFEGFRKTISPDRKNIVKLVDKLEKGVITKEKFSSMVKDLHKNRTGAPTMRQISKKNHDAKREENFYANPFPGCICETSPVL